MLDNILFKEIEKIVQDNIVTEIGVLKSKINPPATEDQIIKLKSIYNLPNEYFDLLRFSNGMVLFNLDDIDGFEFFSTDQIIKENNLLAESEEEKWTGEIIIFCSILGEGNYIAFDLRNNVLLDGFHEFFSEDWEPIELSLNEFLSRLIELKGDKFWLKL
jgi:SMI1 / KNR4 family (SUKH-1)